MDRDGTGGALALGHCLSHGREMIAMSGEQVSPGIGSRSFKEQGGLPVLGGHECRREISPLPKIQRCT